MIDCCVGDVSVLDGTFDQDAQQGLLEGWLCDGSVPLYKGVAFPRD